MNKIVEMFQKNLNKVSLVILLLIAVLCSSILFIPLYYLIFGIAGLSIVILFLYKPEYALYGFVLSTPLVRPNIAYVHFQDVFIILCFISLILNLLLGRYKFASIKTRLDIWIIIVAVLFSIKGFGSLDLARGSLHALRFFEAVTLYYLIVYFIRIKKIKIVTIIKLLVLTTLFQGLLGPLQSLTNSFGVQEYVNDRGYFGYLGIGPKEVYSGRGTFWHFAAYGYFMSTIFLFFLPFFNGAVNKKRIGQLILFILFAGVIFSYSRGALGALIIGVAYYYFIMEKNKILLLKRLMILALIVSPFALYFMTNSEFVESLNPRNHLWSFHIQYLSENIGEFFWGAGFESRELTFYRYAPDYLRHPGDFNPHNLIITYVEEIGITGLIVYIAFWAKVFIDTFRFSRSSSKLMKLYCLALQLILVLVFMSGIYDHVYHDPYLTMFLFSLTGVMYAKAGQTGSRSHS